MDLAQKRPDKALHQFFFEDYPQKIIPRKIFAG